MPPKLDIKLRRPSKTYIKGDIVSGVLYLEHSTEFKHDGITLIMSGDVTFECNPRNPIQLVYSLVDICKGGKVPAGVTEIPFEIPLEPNHNRQIYETYHGVYVNVRYKLKCEIRRGFLGKILSKEIEFCVEHSNYSNEGRVAYGNQQVTLNLRPLDISISPTTLKSSGVDVKDLPNFNVHVHFDSVVCKLDDPLTGIIMFEKGGVIIKSVELQLVRVESCNFNPREDPDRTEIQNIQIVDGNVPDNLVIPIYMPFPKLFTCPTLKTINFTIEFEVNVLITFKNYHLINENISLTLVRP